MATVNERLAALEAAVKSLSSGAAAPTTYSAGAPTQRDAQQDSRLSTLEASSQAFTLGLASAAADVASANAALAGVRADLDAEATDRIAADADLVSGPIAALSGDLSALEARVAALEEYPAPADAQRGLSDTLATIGESIVVSVGHPSGTLQSQIDATPTGGTLDITGQTFNLSLPVTISRALTLNGGGTATITTTAAALVITASNVTITGITITGPQYEYSEGHSYEVGIRAQGQRDAPIGNLAIRGCTVNSFGHTGIEWTYVENSIIGGVGNGNHVLDIGYKGVTLNSCRYVTVSYNTVENIAVHAGYEHHQNYDNAYGIFIGRIIGDAVDHMQSHHITIDHNSIIQVPSWHGIDTHGGHQVVMSYNELWGCMRSLWYGSDDGNNAPSLADGHSVTLPSEGQLLYNRIHSPLPQTVNVGPISFNLAQEMVVTGNYSTGHAAFVGTDAADLIIDYPGGSTYTDGGGNVGEAAEPTGGGGSASWVQNLGGVTSNDTDQTETEIVPSKVVTAGNTIVVGWTGYFDITPSGVTDNLGNTYSRVERVYVSSAVADLWYAPITTGGTLTAITIAHASTQYVAAVAGEISDAAASPTAGGGIGGSWPTACKWASNKTIPADGMVVGICATNIAAYEHVVGAASGTPSTSITLADQHRLSTGMGISMSYATAASSVTGFDGTTGGDFTAGDNNGAGAVFSPA